MAELKPCPFCGSKNATPYSVKSCHSVLCVACGGEGPEADSEEGAIAAWNLRAAGVAPTEAPSNLDLSQRLMQFRNAHWTHWTADENQLVVDCFHALRRTLVGVDAAQPQQGEDRQP